MRLLDEDRFGQFQIAGGKLRVFLAQPRHGRLQASRGELAVAGDEAGRVFAGLGDQLVVEGSTGQLAADVAGLHDTSGGDIESLGGASCEAEK